MEIKDERYWLIKWVEVHLLPYLPADSPDRKLWEERKQYHTPHLKTKE